MAPALGDATGTECTTVQTPAIVNKLAKPASVAEHFVRLTAAAPQSVTKLKESP